jgi:hypothetical protein
MKQSLGQGALALWQRRDQLRQPVNRRLTLARSTIHTAPALSTLHII